jgi:thioredoxin reductase (NADPH)
LVTNLDRLTASRLAIEKVERNDAIDVRTETVPVEFVGEGGKLTGVVLENVSTGDRQTLDVPAAFVFIGLTPNSQLLESLVDTDPQGFVTTDTGMQTSVPGVFVAGDLRSGSTKQAASAAGEGAAAAIAIRRYLEPFGTAMRPNVVDALEDATVA